MGKVLEELSCDRCPYANKPCKHCRKTFLLTGFILESKHFKSTGDPWMEEEDFETASQNREEVAKQKVDVYYLVTQLWREPREPNWKPVKEKRPKQYGGKQGGVWTEERRKAASDRMKAMWAKVERKPTPF